MKTPKTLRPIRDQSLNGIANVITAEWGRRCDRFESGCATCMAWAVFDMMEKITDGSCLDDPDDYRRIMEMRGIGEDCGVEPNDGGNVNRTDASPNSTSA